MTVAFSTHAGRPPRNSGLQNDDSVRGTATVSDSVDLKPVVCSSKRGNEIYYVGWCVAVQTTMYSK